jgi:hypothetical protein
MVLQNNFPMRRIVLRLLRNCDGQGAIVVLLAIIMRHTGYRLGSCRFLNADNAVIKRL